MFKLKITTDKTLVMDDIESYVKLKSKPDHIDYQYDDGDGKFSYFELTMDGQKKYLAVSGKVEVYEKPVTDTLQETFDKEKIK